jgi:hypothetical protein
MAGTVRPNWPTKGQSGPSNEPMGTYGSARGDVKWRGAPRCPTEAYLRRRVEPRCGATVSADLHANGGVAVVGKHPELTSVHAMVAVEA